MSGNILVKPCSLEEAGLPRDLQRKFVPPITALLKGHILISVTSAPFSQWVFDPRSVKPYVGEWPGRRPDVPHSHECGMGNADRDRKLAVGTDREGCREEGEEEEKN